MTAIEPKTDASTILPLPAAGLVIGAVSIETSAAVAAKTRDLRMFQPEWEALGRYGRKRWLLTYPIGDLPLPTHTGRPGKRIEIQSCLRTTGDEVG
jgi:hypothetical protein